MSFYTDWFIAEETEAESLAASESPFEEWQNLSLKSIGEIDLMVLSAILQGKKVEEAESVSSNLLYQDSDEGPFVVRVTPSFVDALANIQDADMSTLAVAWSQTEGFAGAEPSEVSQTIQQLTQFAQQAQRENKPVLSMFVL